MKMHWPLLLVIVLSSPGVRAGGQQLDAVTLGGGTAAAAYCGGEYADGIAALSAAAWMLEDQHEPYTFCLRTTATYACPFYGSDGYLQRRTKKAVAHGTAFAYRRQGKDTLLLTNEHVSDWPVVTDEEHQVEDIPPGCKRVSESLEIVDHESDAFRRDDLALSRVVSDRQLDVAVLRAHVLLPLMPWKIGRSAGLRTRNVVHVRGFPLGIFQATNVGKVISAYDHDGFGDWDHDDFVIDALLSSGNSGSPVLAVSCKTGEFELVGIYHAGYSRGSALNVVVGIDQLKELMLTLKPIPRAEGDRLAGTAFDPRALVAEARSQGVGSFVFPFGSLIGRASVAKDGALVFDVLARTFPFETHSLLAAESLPGADAGAPLDRIWFGNAKGLQGYLLSDLDAEVQAQMAQLGNALRLDSSLAVRYHSAARAVASPEAASEVARLEKSLRATVSAQKDLASVVSDLAERFGPRPGVPGASLADLLEIPVNSSDTSNPARCGARCTHELSRPVDSPPQAPPRSAAAP